MAEFPAEPRLAAMLLASLKYKCSEEVLTIAACCSVESIYVNGREARKRVRAHAGWFFLAMSTTPHALPLSVLSLVPTAARVVHCALALAPVSSWMRACKSWL